MDMTLVYGMLAALAVSLVSMIGVVTLVGSSLRTDRITPYFLSLAAGAMVGNALFHLIPEGFEHYIGEGASGIRFVSLLIIGGFFTFFAIDLFLHSVGKHDTPHEKPIGYLILIGDSLENLVDGIVIGSAFMLSPEIGIATTLAVLVHEIPIELGDFAVLLHSGMSRTKALLWNFCSGFISVFGVVAAWYFGKNIEGFPHLMGPIAAGAFLYMVGSSLVPAIRNDAHFSKAGVHLLIAIGGASIMFALLFLE
jgi:zinc and cadmium transporter